MVTKPQDSLLTKLKQSSQELGLHLMAKPRLDYSIFYLYLKCCVSGNGDRGRGGPQSQKFASVSPSELIEKCHC